MKSVWNYKYNKNSKDMQNSQNVVFKAFRFFMFLFMTSYMVGGHAVERQTDTNGIQLTEKRQVWKHSLDKVIKVDYVEEHEVNASYKFNACFLAEGECVASSEGYRDEFKKITFYYAPGKTSVPVNHVTFYLSLKDYENPQMVMRFVSFDEDWVHLNRIAILVDNEIVYEQVIPQSQIVKEVLALTQVYEIGDIEMTQQLNVVEKIAQGKTVAVRMSGENKDVYLDKQMLNTLRLQAQEILIMYNILYQALTP